MGSIFGGRGFERRGKIEFFDGDLLILWRNTKALFYQVAKSQDKTLEEIQDRFWNKNFCTCLTLI